MDSGLTGKVEEIVSLIDRELFRLTEPMSKAAWWEFRQRQWVDGVEIAHEISAEKLQEIRDKITGGSNSG